MHKDIPHFSPFFQARAYALLHLSTSPTNTTNIYIKMMNIKTTILYQVSFSSIQIVQEVLQELQQEEKLY